MSPRPRCDLAPESLEFSLGASEVQAKLDEVTPKSFNAMLDKEVAMATGAGTYSQKVRAAREALGSSW